MSALPFSADLRLEDDRLCTLCPAIAPKEELCRVQLDAPGVWEWVCEDCVDAYETSREPQCPPNHEDA